MIPIKNVYPHDTLHSKLLLSKVASLRRNISLSVSVCLCLSLCLSLSVCLLCTHTHTHRGRYSSPCFQDSSGSSSPEALNSAKLPLSGPVTTEQQCSHFQTLLITSNKSKAYFSMPPKPMHIYLFRNYMPILLYSYYCTVQL